MNKAFTLIELLAVITILGLLSLLVVPNITENVGEKQQEISDVNKKMLENAADIYIEKNPNNYTYTYESNGSTYCIPIQSLINENILETPIKDEKGKEIDYSQIIKATYSHIYNGFEYEIVNNDNCTEIKNYVSKPELQDDMIPVIYDEDNKTWIKADLTSKWYNYSEKKWANVVIVNEHKSESANSKSRYEYLKSEPGTPILEEDIMAYFVWIPRYRFKYFESVITNEVEIIFEGINTKPSKGLHRGDWKTHEAFTLGSKELSGIWVGKFETSSENPNETQTNTTNMTLRIKPNVKSWRNIQVSNAYLVTQNMKNDKNIYGIKTSDPHVMKNIEWSAAIFLAHSKYGINDEVRLNNNEYYITGCGALEPNNDGTSECEISFNNSDTYPQSTTGNITGIFDMSGGAQEYVMGTLADDNDTPYIGRHNIWNTGFNGVLGKSDTVLTDNNGSPLDGGDDSIKKITNQVDLPNMKYLNIYNLKPHPGHAINDPVGWYDDEQIHMSIGSPWIVRGGTYQDKEKAGIFNFKGESGTNLSNTTFRVVITK